MQRDLFGQIREGLRVGGLFAGEIPMEDPQAAPMNPEYLLAPGEMVRLFDGWTIEAHAESRDGDHERMTAWLIARKPG
ncbi:MAG: hypothetical protein ABI823_09620 [Bryobacteraceae bacterium]